MDMTLRLVDDSAQPDDLRALRTWLVAEEGLRGHVQVIERPPVVGTLGPALDALRIIGDPAAAVLAWALITWLRNQRRDLTVTMKRTGDEVSLTYSGTRLRQSDKAQIQAEIADLAALMVRAEEPGHQQDEA
jgi:hypothetical protein